MLPVSFQLPGAILLLVGGLLACFAGYRLFRVVLGVYGFIVGALLASQLVASNNPTAMLVAALIGGFVGAAVLSFGYFLGFLIVGAGLGALAAHIIWEPLRGEPGAIVVIAFALVGAFAAWASQRYVVVIATALGGAWTAVSGTVALLASPALRRLPRTSDVWIEYPTTLPTGQRWFLIVWLVLAAAGVAVQLTGKGGRRSARGGRR